MGVLRCLVVICCLAFLALQEVQARPGASEKDEASIRPGNNERLEKPPRPQPNNSSGNCSCQTQPSCERNNDCGCNMQIRNCQCQPVIVTECPTTCRPRRRHPRPSCDNEDHQNNQNHFSRPPEKCEEEHPRRQKKRRKPPREECSEEEKDKPRKKRRRKKPSPEHPPRPRPSSHECECDDSREKECPKNEYVPRPCRPIPSTMNYRGFDSRGSYRPIGKIFGWRLIKAIGKIAYLKKRVSSAVFGRDCDFRSRPASSHASRPPSSSEKEHQGGSGMEHLMRFIQSNTGRQMMRIVMSGMAGG